MSVMDEKQEMPPPYNAGNTNLGTGYGNAQNPMAHYQGYNQVPTVPLQQPSVGQFPPVHGQFPPQTQQPIGIGIHPGIVPAPPDHIYKAIAVTICCFWPTGILAIIKNNEAKNALIRGDPVAAANYAQDARKMIIISIIAGIIVMIVFMILIIVR